MSLGYPLRDCCLKWRLNYIEVDTYLAYCFYFIVPAYYIPIMHGIYSFELIII